MSTVINNPGGSGDSSSGAGWVVGVIVAIIIVVLFFLFALPALRDNKNDAGLNVNVDLPGGSGGGTQ